MKVKITTKRLQNKYSEGEVYDLNDFIAKTLINQGEAELYEEVIEEFTGKPLVSVIIPSKIKEEITCLNSLKNQTYENIEIIIEYDRRKNTKVREVAKVRNRGIKKAKGEFIFFCDNDIELYPDAIEKLVKASNGCDWVFGKFYLDNDLMNEEKKTDIPTVGTEEYAMYFHQISACSLVRASINPLFDESMKRYEDWDLWITLDKKGYKGRFLDEVLFYTKRYRGEPEQKDDPYKWTDILFKKHKIGEKVADIIIPHHNQHENLKNCISGLNNQVFNIIIVSGGSFAENCNKGAKLAETDNIIFLNDDTIPKTKDLYKMLDDSDITGIAQDINGIIFYGLYFAEDLILSRDKVHFPSGFCFKIKNNVWKDLGGFNEEFKNGAEDVDLFLRAKEKGYKFSYVKDPIKHIHEASGNKSKENRELLYKIHSKSKIKQICQNE